MKYNITIQGEIGWWPNTGRIVRDEVLSLKGKPCSVYVNSQGGSVVDALEMYQAFKEHGDVTVHIFGFTASAATLLAMGAKTIEMSQNALMLIHKASLFQNFWGSMNVDQLDAAIEKLEKSKDTLNKVDEIIANIYALRAGGTKETFLSKMKKAEWLRASDVKELGLIDKVMDDEKVENQLTNEVKDALLGQKLPLPDETLLHPAEEKTSLADKVRSILTTMGFNLKNENHEEPADDAHLTEQPVMNKEFNQINAILGVEGLSADKEGKITLSSEEMKKINDALVNAEAAKTTAENAKKTAEDNAAAKDVTIKDLQEKVDALNSADGAETAENEGKAEDKSNEAHSAYDYYKEVKQYL